MPKPLYRGTYARRSKAVREAAFRNPSTRCWRCGHTYAEGVRLYGAQGARWQAGHVADGNPLSPLAAEHAKCNLKAGGRRGGGNRTQQPGPRSPNA
jgi:hypothetical protein